MYTSPERDISASLLPSCRAEDRDRTLFRSTSSNAPSQFINPCQLPALNAINASTEYNQYHCSEKTLKRLKTGVNKFFEKNQTSDLIKKPNKKLWPSKDPIVEEQVIHIYDSDDEKNESKILNGCQLKGENVADSLVIKDPVVSNFDIEIEPEKEKSRELRILELRQIEHLLEMQRLSILSTITSMSEKKATLQNQLQVESPNSKADMIENFSNSHQSNQTTNCASSNNSDSDKSRDGTLQKPSKTLTLQSDSKASIIVIDREDEDSKGDSFLAEQGIKSGLLSSESLNGALETLRTETGVGSQFQVCIPEFSFNKKRNNKLKRKPQLIWTPDLIETDHLERIMQDLSKIVRKNVSNQESVTKILKSFQMDDKQMLATIRRKKMAYRNFFHFTPLIPK